MNSGEVVFTQDELDSRTQQFGKDSKQEYLEDFRDCVVGETEHGFLVQTESEQWALFYTKYQKKPPPTLGRAATLVRAMIGGRQVSLLVQEERTATCLSCSFRRVAPDGASWCAQCGCDVTSERGRVVNLASYQENLPHWGCKHPLRGQGLGWKR